MPTYSFQNKETGEIHDEFLKFSEREQYLIDNPHLNQTITSAPGLGDSVRLGIRRPDEGFKEILRKARKDHRTDINTFD